MQREMEKVQGQVEQWRIWRLQLAWIRSSYGPEVERHWGHMFDTRGLLQGISDEIAALVDNMVCTALRWMGSDPPCRFCLVTSGSLSRGEMSPYQPLSLAFVTSQPARRVAVYFDQLGEVLQLLMVSLGETPLKRYGLSFPEISALVDRKSFCGCGVTPCRANRSGTTPTSNTAPPLNSSASPSSTPAPLTPPTSVSPPSRPLLPHLTDRDMDRDKDKGW